MALAWLECFNRRRRFAAQLVPWIQFPALIGEGSLCLWLLVVGVNVERWEKRASAAIRMRSTQMETLG